MKKTKKKRDERVCTAQQHPNKKYARQKLRWCAPVELNWRQVVENRCPIQFVVCQALSTQMPRYYWKTKIMRNQNNLFWKYVMNSSVCRHRIHAHTHTHSLLCSRCTIYWTDWQHILLWSVWTYLGRALYIKLADIADVADTSIAAENNTLFSQSSICVNCTRSKTVKFINVPTKIS